MRSRALLACALLYACGRTYIANDGPHDVDAGAEDAGSSAPDDAGVEIDSGRMPIFVSPNGDDAHDGLTPGSPLRTVAGALHLVKTQSLRRVEIRLCHGTYAEPQLVVDLPVSIRGSYNCSTYTRAGDLDAASTNANETIIEAPNSNASSAALTLRGSSVDADSLIDGLTIRAPTSGANGGTAVRIEEGAAPTLTQNLILAGGTSSSTNVPGAVGVAVVGNASPDIGSNIVRVIGGKGAALGGVAISVDGSQPHIHDNAIRVSAGEGTTACTGVFVTGTSSLTGTRSLARNDIRWDTCKGNVPIAGVAVVAYGVNLGAGTSADVVENTVAPTTGATGSCTATTRCELYGIGATGAHVNVRKNRVHGGDMTIDAAGALLRVRDIRTDTSVFEATNNVVVMGGRGACTTNNCEMGGISIDEAAGNVVASNTVFLTPITNGALAQNAFVAGLIIGGRSTMSHSGDTTFVNNLIVGTSTFASETAIWMETCHGAAFKSLKGNVALGVSQATVDLNGTGCTYTARSFAAAETYFGASIAASNAPVACADWTTCATPIFAGWQSTSLITGLLSTGLSLLPTAPCAIANGGVDVSALLTDDFAGTPRNFPPSAGAWEQNICKQ